MKTFVLSTKIILLTLFTFWTQAKSIEKGAIVFCPPGESLLCISPTCQCTLSFDWIPFTGYWKCINQGDQFLCPLLVTYVGCIEDTIIVRFESNIDDERVTSYAITDGTSFAKYILYTDSILVARYQERQSSEYFKELIKRANDE